MAQDPNLDQENMEEQEEMTVTLTLDDGSDVYKRQTIGLIGMNEVGLNAVWLGEDMTSTKTQEFTKNVLNHMRERLSDYQEKYGDLYNLEATPAESTTYRLAKHDRKKYPDIRTAGAEGDTPYYTNSSHLPVDCLLYTSRSGLIYHGQFRRDETAGSRDRAG